MHFVNSFKQSAIQRGINTHHPVCVLGKIKGVLTLIVFIETGVVCPPIHYSFWPRGNEGLASQPGKVVQLFGCSKKSIREM